MLLLEVCALSGLVFGYVDLLHLQILYLCCLVNLLIASFRWPAKKVTIYGAMLSVGASLEEAILF